MAYIVPTRWGIVGAGLISNDFCIALRNFPQHQHKIVAVAARSLESAQKFSEKHGIEKSYGSYENIASDPDIDVVYIGTINSTHVPLSLLMLEAGKNVLCEKPMALSAASAKTVFDLAQLKKKLYVEGFWSRFFPAYRQLQSELQAGSIGTVKGLTVYFGAKLNFDKERIGQLEVGGGATLDIGCYLVQLACLVFNNEKPEKICVHGSLHSTGVDKSASILLCYEGGRTAQLICNGEVLLPNNAIVYGTDGILEIPSKFWCPSQLKTPKQCFDYPLPSPAEPTRYSNSIGFVYEIESVRQALLNGQTELAEITHADSQLISEIQDEILRQLGVSYDTCRK